MRGVQTAVIAAAGVAAILGALAPAGASAASCANTTAHPESASIAAIDQATLCLLNVERTTRGLRALKENTHLDKASLGHSRDMVRKKYFQHGNFEGRIKKSGYLSGASGWGIGENIAWGGGQFSTPKSIVSMWMHSPGHRANILSRQFKDIGIGVARGAPQRGQHGAATYTTDFGFRG
jgi:uncharacterized protein YkwD